MARPPPAFFLLQPARRPPQPCGQAEAARLGDCALFSSAGPCGCHQPPPVLRLDGRRHSEIVLGQHGDTSGFAGTSRAYPVHDVLARCSGHASWPAHEHVLAFAVRWSGDARANDSRLTSFAPRCRRRVHAWGAIGGRRRCPSGRVLSRQFIIGPRPAQVSHNRRPGTPAAWPVVPNVDILAYQRRGNRSRPRCGRGPALEVPGRRRLQICRRADQLLGWRTTRRRGGRGRGLSTACPVCAARRDEDSGTGSSPWTGPSAVTLPFAAPP